MTDTVTLATPDADGYLDRLVALLRAGRLNHHYPPSRQLIHHLESMHSKAHRGLSSGLEIDPRAGLPTYREWARIQADHSLSPDILSSLGAVELLEQQAERAPTTIRAKQLLKYHYHTFLLRGSPASLSRMDVALRSVDPKTQTAAFLITFDKLDARGVFVRYTIELTQRASRWSRSIVHLEEDIAGHTEELQSLVSRFTSFDAEFTFVRLSANEPITVERVFKATVGPFALAATPLDDAANSLRPLLADHEDASVATFALDIASCDISEDGDNDPIEDLMSASLSDDARSDYEAARRRLGYHVFKDRKFAADRQSMGKIKNFCAHAETQNVMYTLRGGRTHRRGR